ncbi:MAG: hypothetical protein IPQ07_22325 [Myxococcales bacterium]|nr:hypothetical protein [Myxococcales bacterium]
MTPRSRLAMIAVALAVAAGGLLTFAVVRRGRTPPAEVPIAGSGSGDAAVDLLPAPAKASLVNTMVVAIYSAACRHEVGCGTGDLTRCDYIASTMRQLPEALSLQRCPHLDEREARRCLTDLAAGPCANVAPALEVLELQKVIARLPSCRHACE